MKFKHKEDMTLFFSLHTALQLIICDLNNYAREKHGITLTITDTVSTLYEDEMLGRKSNSHRTKRAADIRHDVENSPTLKILELMAFHL